jgi:DNA primase
MPLFPQSFLDDLRDKADIVQVIQESVPLKKAGASYKGLCPFHAEKTPSFHVNRERVSSIVSAVEPAATSSSLELHERIGFQDAVRRLAQRFGLTVPEVAAGGDPSTTRRSARRSQGPRGGGHQVPGTARVWLPAPVRQQLRERGISHDTIVRLGIGYAGPAREALKSWLVQQGFDLPLLVRSGLVIERENGQTVDRFRGRLIVPIARDSGSIVAFAGRATDADQQPKYLNSPETPIYSKSRVLYGLNLTKGDIRRLGYAVLVEGYFDLAQALQAGVLPVVAACGTALTPQQGQLLRRFTSKIVLSYDPDAAGQGAAARSSQLLVTEGFQVNVALLPPGDDPTASSGKAGGAAYLERLKASRPYLEIPST